MKKVVICFLTCYLGFTQSSIDKSSDTITEKETLKNVILLIGDGMGVGQMEIAREFEHGKEGKLFLETLPYTALAHTYSANNKVTDSAAGGTALAIGKKTNNGMIGVTPNGKPSPSILDLFKAHGLKTGIITTNSVTDATPASFTASVKNRWSDQKDIARQQLTNKVDVILGGGQQYINSTEKQGKPLLQAYKDSGYKYVTSRDELMKANNDKLLGLFGAGHLSFKLDRDDLKSKEPQLKEMTEKALDTLSKDKKGFFAMIEGARIDHASHSSDLTSIWKETIEFDEAVKYCVNWAKKRKDTLVIVAADHETMGVSATEPMDIKALKKITISPHYMASQLKKKKSGEGYTKESIKQAFRKYTNIALTDREVSVFNEHATPKKGQVYKDLHIDWEIGSIIASHYHGGIVNRAIEQQSSTGGHTSNMIIVFAYGNGSEIFHGVMDNTDIPKKIAELMGYTF